MTYDTFQELADCLSEVLRGAPTSARAKLMYFQAVEHLSDRRFEQVIDAAIKSLDWFPTPAWVLETAREIARSEAREPVALLPSVESQELDRMTEADRVANLQRLRNMLASAKMPEHRQKMTDQ
jgi:hypothetical protein